MRIVPLLLLMLVTVNVHSSDTYALLDLSLEELLRIKITTVSKKEETIADAPGIVTVFTADDIQAFGARNLKDVLLRIPNYYLFDSHTFYSTGSTLRAGATQHLNNHILYLVNGRPLRESQNGGRQTDINLLFPVSAIDHLEVIRGPGSVLYGSNAFSGTINIITKKETSGIGAGVNITMGEHNYKALEGNAFAGTDDASVHAYINIIDNDGMPVSAFDVEGNLGGINNNRQGHFAKVDASYKGLSLETMFSELNLPSVSGRYRWSTLGDWTHTRNYFNIGYLHSHNKNWTSSINLSQNNLKMYIPVPTPTTYSSNGYLFEFTVNGKINTDTDVVFGAVQDHIKGHLSTNGGNYSTVRSSVYGQVDYRFNLKTKLTAGFQVNKPDRQGAQTSPRLALVHTFNPHWSAKALYAEAFRSPFGSELYFDADFLQGDVNLKPETIKTAEFQLNYSKPEFTISSTLYHSISNHLIGRSNVNGVPTFVNSDQEITYIGTEIEARWAITSKLQLQGNASYQENQDGDGNNDVMAASNTMVKIGLNYTSDYGVSAGIWNNYLGDVAKIEEMPNNSVQVLNPEAKAVNLLSINVLANMEKVLNKSSWSNVEASIYADNILNEKVWFPEMGYKSVNTFPQSHARGVYLKVSVTY